MPTILSHSQLQKNKRIRFKTNFEAKRSMLNSLKGVSIDSVPIVSEYPDVFPEE